MQEEHQNVSILFCDIVDFEKMMKIENQRIVEILDGLFRQYDIFCSNHGIQKIEVN